MKVLFAVQYYPPEITAGALRAHGFASGLARLGHEVSVICGIPNHPAGQVAPGYGGRFVQRERRDGVGISYAWVRTSPGRDLAARLANYGSYAASATAVGLAASRPDVVLASSPPPTVGSVGATLSLRHRVPWVLDVRDLWPDAAVALGQVGEGRMVEATRRLERRIYRSADAITTTTQPFAQAISSRGGAGKLTVIPNGTTATFLDAGDADPEPELLGGGGEAFRWTYAGNLGLVAGLETAVEAASLLREGFRLTIVGDGQRKPALRELAASLPEGSVEFVDAVPPAEAARLMRASDALLVCRAPNPALNSMVLAKLYDSSAVRRPIVVAAAGETARLAHEEGSAIVVPPGDPQAIADAIRRLRDDEALRARLSEGARAFAEANSRERQARELARVLESVVV